MLHGVRSVDTYKNILINLVTKADVIFKHSKS